MKYILWIFGILLLVSGIFILTEGKPLFACIICMASGIALLPPVSDRFPSQWWIKALIAFIGLAAFSSTQPKQAQAPKAIVSVADSLKQAKNDSLAALEEQQQTVLRKRKSDADASFIKAARAIKRNLKDPDSYEEMYHQAAYVGKNGVYVACLVTYRAKNSFGAFDVAKATVTFNEQMEPIDVVPVE